MLGLDSAAFNGEVTVLNVWASWCVPCHDEAPLLLKLAADRRIRVAGINYKDEVDNARRFLGRHGNPFVANGIDWATAAPPSSGASMACRRRSWLGATAGSRSS